MSGGKGRVEMACNTRLLAACPPCTDTQFATMMGRWACTACGNMMSASGWPARWSSGRAMRRWHNTASSWPRRSCGAGTTGVASRCVSYPHCPAGWLYGQHAGGFEKLPQACVVTCLLAWLPAGPDCGGSATASAGGRAATVCHVNRGAAPQEPGGGLSLVRRELAAAGWPGNGQGTRDGKLLTFAHCWCRCAGL